MGGGVIANLVIRIQASLGDFEKQLQTLPTALQRTGSAMKSVGTLMTAAITVPLAALAVGAAKTAMDFESSFAGVKKTVNATDAEFAQMAQQFRNLAKEIPVNVNELNRLGEAAGAMGIPKANIVEFARVMALLGVTTNLTSDQAAEGIGKIQNIFGAGGQQTDRFAATLVALGNDGASTETQILEMATRIAGAGNTIGMSQGQVLGYASALSSVGLEAEAGGTAISRVFIDLASAVSKGGQDLANFAKVAGMPVKEFASLFKKDAAGATLNFIEGLGRIKTSGGNLLGVLEALGFTEIRQRDTLMRAAGAGDLLRRALDLQNTAWRDNSALSAEASKRFETTESQLKLLGNQLIDVGITIGNALLPFIKALVAAFKEWMPFIERAAQAFADLSVPVQAIIIGFLGLLAAIGPVLFIVGQLIYSASLIANAMKVWGISMTALGMTAGTAALAFGGLAFYIGLVWAAWKIGNIESVKNTIAEWTLRLGGMTKEEAHAAVQGNAWAHSVVEQGNALDAALAPLKATLLPMASHGKVTREAGAAANDFTVQTAAELAALIKLREEMEKQRALGSSWSMYQGMNIDKAGGLDAVLARGKTDLNFDITPTLDQQRLFQQLRYAIPNIKQESVHIGITMGQSIRIGIGQALQGLSTSIVHALEGGGGFAGAMKAIGVQIADVFVEAFLKRLAITKLGERIMGFFNPGGGVGVGVGGGGGGGTAAGVSGAMSKWGGALAGASTGLSVGLATGSKTFGALAGIGSGAIFGAMLGGPIGAGIGAAVGGIAGLIGGIFGHHKKPKVALPSVHTDPMARFRAATASANSGLGGGGGAGVVNQTININGVLDRDSVRQVFREHIIPLTKQALMLNTDGLGEAHAFAMDGR